MVTVLRFLPLQYGLASLLVLGLAGVAQQRAFNFGVEAFADDIADLAVFCLVGCMLFSIIAAVFPKMAMGFFRLLHFSLSLPLLAFSYIAAPIQKFPFGSSMLLELGALLMLGYAALFFGTTRQLLCESIRAKVLE